MHAASVHPEPGSNSRNHCIKTSGLPDDPILLSSLALSFFYFLLSSILICKNFPRSVSSFSLCTSLLLFNFQWSVFASLSRDLVIIPHRPAFVNPFFQTFLKSFSGSSALPSVLFSLPALRWASILYYIPRPFVKNFFYFFPLFLPFRHFKQFLYVILYDFLGV